MWRRLVVWWQGWLQTPRHLYAYVLIKTLIVLFLMLLYMGKDEQNVVYMDF